MVPTKKVWGKGLTLGAGEILHQFSLFSIAGVGEAQHILYTFLLLEVPSSVFLLLSGACVFFLCFCLCEGSQFLLVCFLALWFWRVYMSMQT